MMGAKCEQGLYLERASERPCFHRGASTPTAGPTSPMLREGGDVGAYACYMPLSSAWLGSFVGQLLRRVCVAAEGVQEW